MDKLVTIIVPVYNKELFLHDCIESINCLNIENEQVEAIFVDDCSTDSSVSIIESYQQKYDFLKLIKLDENTGSPAEPRNVGINLARGKYMTFLDADDWLDYKGFPNLLLQANEHNSDIAFGQSIKHDDKGISKLGRFTSFKVENELIPYEIDKIFRAVGPPGKIIKTEVIKSNNIKFKHLKFGEDKLFFIETISRCKTASMNPKAVYHVNRYNENQSLVTETNILEKTVDNLIVLEEVLNLNIPLNAEFQAISRIVEVDFISRLFNKKRFLKSDQKVKFYDYFQRLIDLLYKNGKHVEDYIIEDKYKNNYKLLKEQRYDDLFIYIEMLIKGGKADRFIKDNQVYFLMPVALQDLLPVTEEMFAVYEGTRDIDGEYYEQIKVYKNQEIEIDKVLLTEIYNEPHAKEVHFEKQGDKIYIKSSELETITFNFNIVFIYNGYKPYTVNMNLPNSSANITLKRQNFKAEFVQKEKSRKKTDTVKRYFHFNPQTVTVLNHFKLYNDVEFKERVDRHIEIGELIEVKGITHTKKGTPRLIIDNDKVITANRNFVSAVTKDNNDKYYYEVPHKVKTLKQCKEYDSRNFKNTINTIDQGTVIAIEKIILSDRGTPRLKTYSDTYITANKEFVQAIGHNNLV
ncbi:glycosyltransferase family 2 protein [Staphylococcus gallinarum]|uniref:Glycosyltransferase family 2 protein n=1 Tax=Staphylococcus gallinarum TaxID=1293 RepID=A0A3A0W131_STAGA|nr:glycosyltransferase family 2 protein [Staphylococcus gallinarum]RIP33614.1 glycosyltransferase family 2 protein [Staphylococcus gallinarum]